MPELVCDMCHWLYLQLMQTTLILNCVQKQQEGTEMELGVGSPTDCHSPTYGQKVPMYLDKNLRKNNGLQCVLLLQARLCIVIKEIFKITQTKTL